MAGLQARVIPFERAPEEFEEPQTDLLVLEDEEPPNPRELAHAQILLREREQTIQMLEARLASLQDDRAKLVEQLRSREAELSELSELLLPALRGTRESRQADEQVPHAAPALEFARLRRATLRLIAGGAGASAAASSVPDASSAFDLAFLDELTLYADITQDVKRGGVFVATYQRVPLGSCVELTLELEDDVCLQIAGDVSWLRDPTDTETHPGIGIRFRAVSDATLAALGRTCGGRELLYVEL